MDKDLKYLHWNQETITDFSDENISKMYENGFVFTRLDKGLMHQTRSVRINISKFTLSSENKRILKKTADLVLTAAELPLLNYDYRLGKLAKDFFENKFGHGIMSAQKIKEMLTDPVKSNFNLLLTYLQESSTGYAICFANNTLLHYSYPFYDLNGAQKDIGLGMMVRAINFAVEQKKKYVYLGSLQRPGDTYKLQFDGLEWFDGSKWQDDIETVKKILASLKINQ
ncbi:MAG: hypothetical protein WC648_03815 [Candidatus Paceibacterota bacterium]|jgi:arginyl-tRNA--protein-N-Asp/Glu arginylyltransferase